MSNFLNVGQPPSAVTVPDSRGRLFHMQGNASTELLKLFFRGVLLGETGTVVVGALLLVFFVGWCIRRIVKRPQQMVWGPPTA